MEQRLSIVTLGVRDLAASKAFYENVLGWRQNQPASDTIAFYNVGSMIIALYPDALLADDITVEHVPQATGAYRGFTLAQNLSSRTHVDELFAELRAHGVQIVKEPHEVFWGGYSGYFADADGYHWEVAHNPYWENGPDGPITPA